MRIILSLLLFSSTVHADNTSWVCTDEATTRSGGVWTACGVGWGMDEGSARLDALNKALNEFTTMCKMSASCKDKEREVEPTRSTCSVSPEGWKCYRAVRITLVP